MRNLLLGLLLHLWGEPGRCLEDVSFTFDGDIRHFAVATNSVYVATEQKLYQLRHDLTVIHSLSQRGTVESRDQMEDAPFHRVSDADKWNATFGVNILVPFVENGTLISCGLTACGYCEVRDLANISKLLHKENIQVGPTVRSSASVGFLVNVKNTGTETYILTAIQQYVDTSKKGTCASTSKAVNLHNTDNKQDGGIFSLFNRSSAAVIKRKGDAEFVDGFQINSIIYLFANVPLGISGTQVRLLWFEGKTSKSHTLRSLRGATLRPSDGAKGAGRSKLLASSVIPGGPPVHWSGVFSTHGGPADTELIVFDISPDLTGETDVDPHFYCGDKEELASLFLILFAPKPKLLRPLAVLLRQTFMTSVMAVRQKAWMVFFIGTGDGQLIKLAVDKAYQAVCPKVMYKAKEDRQVFPKMHLDVVDRKHVYVAFRDQMMRVSVSKCDAQTSLQACWSAQDPYCGWCSSKQRCTFEEDCPDSLWLSISDDSHQKKMVSYQVGGGGNGQVTLHVQTHLTVGQPEALSNFACKFSTTSEKPSTMGDSAPQFPRCTCILSESMFSSEGVDVTVEIRLGRETLKEQLKLLGCSGIRGPPTPALCRRCIAAGCGWSNDECSWATAGFMADGVCKMLESGMNYSSKPEIFSVIPSDVSFYGRNNAAMTGRNLGNVTRVRIQAAMNCSPQESPVWNNTGMNLTFHIPSADKGLVNVCAVLPDGSCHGNAKITYRSSPSCAAVMPRSTWVSGKRTISIVGSHLDFVEGIIHSHAPHKVNLPTIINSAVLTYDTPPTANSHEIFTSTMYLKVANETIDCFTSITYQPDPKFLRFSSVRTEEDLRVTIQKKADKLEMTTAELTIWIVHKGTQYICVVEAIDTDFVIYKVRIHGSKTLLFYISITSHSSDPILYCHYNVSILLYLLLPKEEAHSENEQACGFASGMTEDEGQTLKNKLTKKP